MNGKGAWLLVGGAVACLLVVLGVMRSCDRDPTGPEAKADTLLRDSIPIWRRQKDSTALANIRLAAEADSAKAQRLRERSLRLASQRRTDSLELARTQLQQSLDSATSTPLPGTASASDSAQWWRHIAGKQAGVIGALEGENRALRQGDEGYEREIKSLEQENGTLRRLATGRQEALDVANQRIETLTGALDTLRRSIRRCTLLKPCLGMTVGPGLALEKKDGSYGVRANLVQVNAGVRIDL